MIGSSQDFKLWALPRGLLGMVVLVAFVEGELKRRAPDLANISAESWRESGRAASNHAPGCEVLCFGDSMVKFGVVPKVIERQIGRSAYNLAVLNGLPPVNDLLYQRALRRGARPRALVVDGDLLQNDPRDSLRAWAELLEPFELIELVWTAQDPDLLLELVLAQLFVSIRTRFEIGEQVRAVIEGRMRFHRIGLEPFRRNWESNRGAQIVADRASELSFEDFNALADLFATEWTCNPLNGDYVRRFLRRADDRNVPVFWLLPPVHPTLQGWRDRVGWDDQRLRFLVELQAEFPNMILVDARHSGYGDDLILDLSHLRRHGAYAFSTELAILIAARLDGGPEALPRQVELPYYREWPTEIELEDLSESLVAVQESIRTRRQRR
ncbi:hypothetical protein BH23PLA1_BH23PLA1_06790 [soil metagenome]